MMDEDKPFHLRTGLHEVANIRDLVVARLHEEQIAATVQPFRQFRNGFHIARKHDGFSFRLNAEGERLP